MTPSTCPWTIDRFGELILSGDPPIRGPKLQYFTTPITESDRNQNQVAALPVPGQPTLRDVSIFSDIRHEWLKSRPIDYIGLN